VRKLNGSQQNASAIARLHVSSKCYLRSTFGFVGQFSDSKRATAEAQTVVGHSKKNKNDFLTNLKTL